MCAEQGQRATAEADCLPSPTAAGSSKAHFSRPQESKDSFSKKKQGARSKSLTLNRLHFPEPYPEKQVNPNPPSRVAWTVPEGYVLQLQQAPLLHIWIQDSMLFHRLLRDGETLPSTHMNVERMLDIITFRTGHSGGHISLNSSQCHQIAYLSDILEGVDVCRTRRTRMRSWAA